MQHSRHHIDVERYNRSSSVNLVICSSLQATYRTSLYIREIPTSLYGCTETCVYVSDVLMWISFEMSNLDGITSFFSEALFLVDVGLNLDKVFSYSLKFFWPKPLESRL